MKVAKREKKINGERWFAEYSTVPKNTGQTPEDDAWFRFRLGRTWDIEKPPVMFIGLNPSTATHLTNDRTVARCTLDAKRWGYGGLFMMNVFPYRATKPQAMRAFYKNRFMCHEALAEDSFSENTRQIVEVSNGCTMIICAWGNHGKFLNGGRNLVEILHGFGKGELLNCYRITKQGEPEHPLYQLYTAQTQPFSR